MITNFINGIKDKWDKIKNGLLSIGADVKDLFKKGYEAGVTAIASNYTSNEASRRKSASFLLPAYAAGTNYHPGGLAMVGEKGPELINMPRGTQVTANANLNKINNKMTLDGEVIVKGVSDLGQLVGVTKIIAKEMEQGDRRLAGRVRVMPSMA